MTAIALLLLVITSSLLITRSAAVMLELTGMSKDSARFQARAAFCGVGYSSKESEGIIEHPVRRQIISTLMLLGNAGTATVVATLIMSFTENEINLYTKLICLVIGVAILFAVMASKAFDRQLRNVVTWALKTYTRLDLNDYTALLHLSKGFTVLEIDVKENDWLAGNSLSSLSLPKEGVLVLGIKCRDGQYIGAPNGQAEVNVGDTMTLYGRLDRLEELNHRRRGVAGAYAHEAAVEERNRKVAEKAAEDEENVANSLQN